MNKKNIKKTKYSDIDNCPIRNIISRIGDKWSLLILLVLNDFGKIRFNDIKRTIGEISQKMLSQTLQKLEFDGLIARQYYNELPPRVEYSLTQLGKSLIPIINNLAKWADDNKKIIKISRNRYIKQEKSWQTINK